MFLFVLSQRESADYQERGQLDPDDGAQEKTGLVRGRLAAGAYVARDKTRIPAPTRSRT